MPILIALAAGIIFGAGLTISQMTNPEKIRDFLDVAAIRSGGWDPTLLMVFAGALPVMFFGYVIQRGMLKPLAAPHFEIPSRTDIDWGLITGSVLFGIGWGLVGMCPGPAFAGLVIAGPKIGYLAVFIVAMLAGVYVSTVLRRALAERQAPAMGSRASTMK